MMIRGGAEAANREEDWGRLGPDSAAYQAAPCPLTPGKLESPPSTDFWSLTLHVMRLGPLFKDPTRTVS